MKDTQSIPPEEFIPESLRQTRHQQPAQKKNDNTFGLLLGIGVSVVLVCVAFWSYLSGNLAGGVGGFIVLLIGVAFGLALYFLPTIIAIHRDHRNAMALATLNLFLGWTLVGWVISLVWSLLANVSENGRPR